MKISGRNKLAIFTGFLISVFVAVDRGVMKSQAVGGFTAAEIESIESMANRVAPAQEAAGPEPELPRVFINTSYTPPTGRTIAVPAGGDFQAAINQAQPGDIITLQAGATYSGNFTLPAKTGAGWIVIRTSAPDSSLPAPGKRITPAHASVLPKIVTPNHLGALEALDGAHHYRLIGLEFAMGAGVTRATSLVVLGDQQNTLAKLPHNLILDRVYIHGSPTVTLRRGVTLNSATTAIIDSYFSDCHDTESDSQAIGGWNGAGPFKIVNNYLEGAGENFILGGADPTIANLVPSDIEFRRNHCFKPLSWRIGDPSYAGRPWGVKNLFELKSAQRVLVDGNIFEHNWTHAQIGYAILLTVRNQDGTAPWSVVQDVTITNNIVRSVGGGFNMHGTDDNRPSLPTRRVRISNNLLEDVDSARWGGPGIAFHTNGGPHDITIEHNTVFHTGNLFATTGTPTEGVVFRNNLSAHNEFGVKGDGRGTGADTIDFYFPGSVFRKNVMVGGLSTLYPSDNFFPPSFDQVVFVNRAGGNFRLAPTSPFKNAGTDGKDIGVDLDALNAALGGAGVLSSVSAASFVGDVHAPEAISSAFGVDFSTATLPAPTLPLPTLLGGTTVKVRDRTGTERLSPLFYMSPTQINYLVPSGTATGTATVSVTSADVLVATGLIQVANVAPGLFTVDGSGRGLPAALVYRVGADRSERYEPLVRFDQAQNKFVPVPIDLGPGDDQVFLILYATGVRFRSSLAAVSARVGGVDTQVLYAGDQGSFTGLDQINLLLSQNLAGSGDADVALTMDGRVTNIVRVNIK